MPFTNNKKSNLDLSKALVNKSARWSSVWTLTTSISLFKQSRMKTWEQQLEAAMYSASHVDVATHVCFLHCHVTRRFPKN
uniref:Uncharacterized protein n=1 Tax=Helianthus annuus TaxID=4232 RepID=A0A251TZL0_HELAN